MNTQLPVSGNSPPADDCGGSEFGCKVANTEANRLPCHGCIERNRKRDEERELVARTNYCRMFHHDLRVLKEGDEWVLHCANRCAIDGKYKAVPR